MPAIFPDSLETRSFLPVIMKHLQYYHRESEGSSRYLTPALGIDAAWRDVYSWMIYHLATQPTLFLYAEANAM